MMPQFQPQAQSVQVETQVASKNKRKKKKTPVVAAQEVATAPMVNQAVATPAQVPYSSDSKTFGSGGGARFRGVSFLRAFRLCL
jgi:hypothetical protein